MKPILCNYYITYRCNARCVFCDIWRYPEKAEAAPESVLSNLAGIRRLGCRFIDFTGGEPLLHEHLPLLLRRAKQAGLITSVTTNCLLYPQRAGELAGLVDLLHFSLDSDSAPLHDELRGIPCYDRVLESIDKALAAGERPDLLFTVTDRNVHALGGLARLARRKKLMLVVNPAFSYFGNKALASQGVDVLRAYARQPHVYINLALLRLIRAGGNQVWSPRCRAATSTVVISPNNELVLPCFHHRQGAVPIDGDIVGAWNSSQARGARAQQGRYAFCAHCTINCYFDPSFLYKVDRYFWESLISKARYAFHKYVSQRDQVKRLRLGREELLL